MFIVSSDTVGVATGITIVSITSGSGGVGLVATGSGSTVGSGFSGPRGSVVVDSVYSCTIVVVACIDLVYST